jgi:predicted chitinase
MPTAAVMQTALPRQEAQSGQGTGLNLNTNPNETSTAQQDIAQLAYFLWQSRGCPEGSPEQDWFEAERKIQGV